MVKYSKVFEIESWSKYNPLSLTFLCVNRQTQDHWALVGARGNYLEKAAMLQVDGGMLITLVDSEDAAASFSFVQSLYGLINYETMHRWFIWEREVFPHFFFLSHVHSSWGKPFYLMSERCVHIMYRKLLTEHWKDRGLSSWEESNLRHRRQHSHWFPSSHHLGLGTVIWQFCCIKA